MKPKPKSPRPSDQLNRREEVWVRAFTLALSCPAVGVETAMHCADECLEHFEERFGQ